MPFYHQSRLIEMLLTLYQYSKLNYNYFLTNKTNEKRKCNISYGSVKLAINVISIFMQRANYKDGVLRKRLDKGNYISAR